jgi:quinoprotein glucose dehydrogenase
LYNVAVSLLLVIALSAQNEGGFGWPTYGGAASGTRYSRSAQINPKNVHRLVQAWTFHTNALSRRPALKSSATFEATPILLGESLYLTTPFDEVIALDGTTGKMLWSYDPQVKRMFPGTRLNSRGVATWPVRPQDRSKAFCGQRIFLGTHDATLIALDAATGALCSSFGQNGRVDLSKDVFFREDVEYKITSTPTVVGDVVVVGSSVGDDQTVEAESGVVRGYDARSGKLLWSWDPIPWAKRQNPRTGGGNAWSTITADTETGMIFVPTGSASPDFYGGLRPGDNRYANSLVALEGATGKLIWGFQLIHHDLWDYDVASQPLLFTFRNKVPAVAIATKTGSVFVLDRRTGVPLYPVHENQVPQSDIPGETASPTQPISSLPPLTPQTFRAEEGMFTPPSLRGTVVFPGLIGGVNWGSMALDAETGVLYANTNKLAYRVQLIPREERESTSTWYRGVRYLKRTASNLTTSKIIPENTAMFAGEILPQKKTPYYVLIEPIVSDLGYPCTPPPWGAMTALNLNTGTKVWQTSLGTMMAGTSTGSINLGGPMVTAGHLVFSAATANPLLQAFDAGTGKELWHGALPVPAQSTPMTYMLHGRQYVVICAGGHAPFGTPVGDSVIAFALP